MSVTLNFARDILQQPKWLIEPVNWQTTKDRHAPDVMHKLETRIRLAETVPRGLWFRCQTWERFPQKAVFQIECDFPSARAHLPLYRFELSPFSSHLNGAEGPPSLSGLFIEPEVTHEHSYLLYSDLPDRELKLGSDPLARIVENPPHDFVTALSYVCRILNVQNGGAIPIVPTQTSLV